MNEAHIERKKIQEIKRSDGGEQIKATVSSIYFQSPQDLSV